jgi:hypothetical protein
MSTGISRSNIQNIIFIDTPPTGGTLFDLSAASPQDGSVLASWDGVGTMTIGADGGVVANMNCSFLFYSLSNLTTLDLTHFHAEYATNMSYMFFAAILPTTDITFPAGFGSKATNMNSMFSFCTLPANLTEFPTGFGSQAIDMSQMFVLNPGGALPTDLTFPDDFGSKAENMSQMFYQATLPANLIEFPAGFGSMATNMSSIFGRATLPANLTELPTGFGSRATNIHQAFLATTFQGNLDWSRTNFANLNTTFNVLQLFHLCNFNGYTVKVHDQATKDKFVNEGNAPVNSIIL